MKRYRIVENNGRFKVQSKKIFTWEDCPMFGYSIIAKICVSIEDAKRELNRIINDDREWKTVFTAKVGK